jgi:hypothetical protein
MNRLSPIASKLPHHSQLQQPVGMHGCCSLGTWGKCSCLAAPDSCACHIPFAKVVATGSCIHHHILNVAHLHATRQGAQAGYLIS